MTRAVLALAFAVGGGALVAGCRTEQTFITPHPHLERMLKQEKLLPYENAAMLPNGMAMQVPPEGTEPVDALLGDPLVNEGAAQGHFAERIPIHIDKAMVEGGRRQFETICAPCHGILGDGDSVVGERMNLRKPADLLGTPRGYTPGEIFRVIRLGYGLMPSYRHDLSVEDTWGVVAYVRALQLSRAVPVDRLPPALKARLEAQ
jgi:mono/diheme cytochrome c family protein